MAMPTIIPTSPDARYPQNYRFLAQGRTAAQPRVHATGRVAVGRYRVRMALLDADEFERWREQATATMTAAAAIRAAGSWSWCCFLCEQAAQLATKGLLRAIGRPSDAWGHDPVTLVARAGEAMGEPLSSAAMADASARLTRHYIPARYPDAHPAGTPADHYRESDAASATADADRLIGAVDAVWHDLGSGTDRRDADGESG
jgi:HEPN domain-containing protein